MCNKKRQTIAKCTEQTSDKRIENLNEISNFQEMLGELASKYSSARHEFNIPHIRKQFSDVKLR